MFSGIVEECARVVGIVKEQENVHFTLSCSFVDELKIDQSVSHNGVCLTVVRIQDGTYTVTAMKETLDRSNLGRLKVGDEVNVERSMLMNGRLDGHIVQGHVDGPAECVAVDDAEGSHVFTFRHQVCIIPYTFEHTNFHGIKPGSVVNIEFDIIGKYLSRMMDLVKE